MQLMKIWDAMCGRNPLAEKESFEKTAASLQVYLNDYDKLTILCAGTINKEKIELSVNKLINELQRRDVDVSTEVGHKYTFIVGGNVLAEASCIENVNKVDGIILFEEAYSSSFNKIDEEINAFKVLQKDIIGTVLIHH